MPKDRGQNRSVFYGALIVAVLIAITIVLFFIPDVARKLRSSIEVVAITEDAGTLEKGSEVWIAGREVGTVAKVELRHAGTNDPRRIAVTMEIPSKYRSYVRKDSEVRITTASLIGESVIDVLTGTPRAAAVRDNDTLAVRASGTLTALLEKTEALTAHSEQFFDDMKTVERRTTRRTEELSRLKQNFETTMTEFRAVTVAMRNSPLRTFSDPEFKRLLNNLNASSSQISSAFHSAAERARRAQSDAEPALRRLAARADTIRGIVGGLQAKIEEGGGGLLIRAQKDSAIVKGLHAAQVELDSLMAETKRNPLRFWF